jgi:capsular exopolysaccharide synthesis family protein
VVNNADVQLDPDPLSDEMSQTVLATFQSRGFAQQLVEHYHLLTDPDFFPDGKTHTIDEGIGMVQGIVRAKIQQGTRFINVGALSPNPLLAKRMADMLANTYILESMESRNATSNLSIESLKEQAAQASDTLTGSEKALQDYVKAKNTGSLVGANDTIVSELKAKNAALSGARAERLGLESDEAEIQKHLNDPDALQSIPSVANYPAIADSVRRIKTLEATIPVLQLRYTAIHPKMIQAQTELDHEKKILSDNLKKMPSLIHAAHEAALEKEKECEADVKSQEALTIKLDDDRIQYDVLSRNEQTDQATYDNILTRLKDAKVATGTETTNVHVFEPAQLPSTPMQAKKSLTLAATCAGGLLVGLMLSLGLHKMDSSVKTVDQAEDVLGLTVLASIPRQSPSRLKDSGLALIKFPASPVAEAFRSLRTSLYLAGRAKGRKIVLFTSTLAGEGKTFCSTNYATALAQQGLTTLLIDADLRSPMVRKVLLEDRDLPGLGELLSRKIDLPMAIHQSDIENLWVMPAGDLLPNPAELLARGEMGDIVRRVSEKFDRIVIDTAPVTAVSDTLLLVEHAQAICLVTYGGKTPRKWVLRALKLIAEAGSRPVGVILNQMALRMGAYSYYPGKYGEPEVYGSNGRHKPKRKGEEAEVIEPVPRF